MAATGVSVLITGANRGLGLEMVKQLLEGPQKVGKLFACCRDPDGPRAVELQTLKKKHSNIILVRMDVSDLKSIEDSVQQVRTVVGNQGLNLVINNAGIIRKSRLEDSTQEEMKEVFDTNVVGPMNIMQKYLPLLRDAVKASKKPGMSCCKAAVIGISSLLGSVEMVKPSYHLFPAIPYRVSKAGLNMLTECAAAELQSDEILFSLLHPGWVRTEMGGEEGEIDAQESVKGMLSVMATMTEKHNGSFLDYKGETVPW